MATFGEIQTDIADMLLDPSNTAVSASIVATAINNSIAYWKFRRFWFNTAVYDSTMIAQDPKIYLPTGFLVELPMNDGFVISYSNSLYPIIKRNPRDYDEIYSANGYGMPRIYRLKAGEYNVYPLPDQAYTCKVWYLKDYANLVNSGDTNDFTNNASQLITYWAASKLFAERRQDDKMEAYYSARAQDEYKNLQIRNEKANSSGHITIHSIL